MTERRIRVARIIARLNVGGPARHVVWLTAGLPDADFETLLVTGTVPPGEDDMSQFAHDHRVTPLVIPEMSREISPRDMVTVWKLFRLFLQFRPDIVHTHTAKAGTSGRLAGWLYRWLSPGTLVGRPRNVRFVHTFHGHVFHSYYGRAKTTLFLLIERLLAWMVTDVIVTISEQQREEIQSRFNVGRPEQFRVIPLGLDLDSFHTRRDSASEDPLVVAIVGRLTAIKNHELFLRVAARMRDRDPAIRFVVYGDGSERRSLERRAASLSLDVRFEGTRPVEEIYATAGIVMLTSLNEGTPLTLLEAMASGVPVISTAVGGVGDVLGSAIETIETPGRFEIRQRGVTAASNDEEGLTAGLERLAGDPALRHQLAAAGREYVKSTRSKERLLGDIAQLYRELTGGPAGT
ncbi:MAG TPA: glycosyltransferase [Thermoanaerobaculia bacterium]